MMKNLIKIVIILLDSLAWIGGALFALVFIMALLFGNFSIEHY